MRSKIVLYNILFGMKGNSAFNAVLSNLCMHGLRPVLPFGLLPGWIRKLAFPMRSRHLSKAMDLVEKHSPDILCLNEVVLGPHKEELEKRLKKMGFSSILYGECRHHDYPFRISLVLASKKKAVQMSFSMTMEARPGGAGGAAALFIPEDNLSILGVHLALPGEVLDKEMSEVNRWIERQKQSGRKIIVAGDFNCNKQEAEKSIPLLKDLRETAYLTCPSFHTVFKKPDCIDHIFYDGNFMETDSGTEQGLSDHKLIWAELNTI